MPESSPTKKYDLYASILNFKKEISTLNSPFLSIDWIPEDHLRRIQAYEIFASYYYNFSRDYRFNPESGDTSQNDTIKEMGDAAWLCNKIKSKLLGEEITLSVKEPKALRKYAKLKAELEAGNTENQAKVEELETLRAKIAEAEEYLHN